MSKSNFDDQLQITDLDTGRKITIDEYQAQLSEASTNLKPQHFPPSTEFKLPDYIDFSQFIHQIKQPIFKNIHITQCIKAHSNHIWVITSSLDGNYFATGGEDGLVNIFKCISNGPNVSVQLVQKYEHKGDVTSLSFSSTGFLLSSSMDTFVHLYHVDKQKILSRFKHQDAVTTVSFLPTDDSIFVACTFSLGAQIWSIRDNVVLKSLSFVSTPTAAAFSPDGSIIAIGCFNGFCFLYSLPDFRYLTQFIAGPRKKKQTENKKITSIVFNGDNEFFISTNDSRIRLYSRENYSVIRKFLGHESTEAQIKASVSMDHQLLMSSSESGGAVFIWPINHQPYFKGIGFSRDRSKSAQGFKFGRHTHIVASSFIKDSSINKLSCVSGDQNGYLYVISSN